MRCDLLAVSVLLFIAPAKTINIQWTLAKPTGIRYINYIAERTTRYTRPLDPLVQ